MKILPRPNQLAATERRRQGRRRGSTARTRRAPSWRCPRRGRGEEHREPAPPGVCPLAALDHLLAPLLVLAGSLEELAAPAVPDGVADEAAHLAGRRRHHDHRGKLEPSLAGRDAGQPQRGGADDGHAGPRRGHRDEEHEVLPPRAREWPPSPGCARTADLWSRTTAGGVPARRAARTRHVVGDGSGAPGAASWGASEPARSAMPTIAKSRPTMVDPVWEDPLFDRVSP